MSDIITDRLRRMEDFIKAMYACCRQAGLEIVPIDVGAKVMAWCGLQGGDEMVSLSPRLRTELEHLQELYHIKAVKYLTKTLCYLYSNIQKN